MNRFLLATLFAATSALAGPYDEVYSIITTDLARSADPHVIPVIVNRVDDKTVSYQNRAVVPPGAHKVTVDVPPRKGFKLATQNTFDLDTKPCVRYYVAAKLDTLVTQGWTPIVRSEERIGECEKKFKVAGAK
ncbi:MAG: hypothetical protein ACXWHC_11425 [Usitatibacter sp.]